MIRVTLSRFRSEYINQNCTYCLHNYDPKELKILIDCYRYFGFNLSDDSVDRLSEGEIYRPKVVALYENKYNHVVVTTKSRSKLIYVTVKVFDLNELLKKLHSNSRFKEDSYYRKMAYFAISKYDPKDHNVLDYSKFISTVNSLFTIPSQNEFNSLTTRVSKITEVHQVTEINGSKYISVLNPSNEVPPCMNCDLRLNDCLGIPQCTLKSLEQNLILKKL